MSKNKTLPMVIMLCATLSANAQQDRLPSYGAPGFAVPGSSAVTFGTPAGMRAATMKPSLAIERQATNVHERYVDNTDAHNQSQASADTTRHQSAAMQSTQNSFVYPVPLSACYNHYGVLHQGFNVSMGMSVFAAFGKNAPKGAGFAQNLSATWLQPLGHRGWLAVGGSVNHANWSGSGYTSGALHAQLGYQFNEHWSGYLYGQKNIVNDGQPLYGYLYGRGLYSYSPLLYSEFADKLGAAIRWTPNHSLSVELSVEKDWFPQSNTIYPDRYKYNYPTP